MADPSGADEERRERLYIELLALAAGRGHDPRGFADRLIELVDEQRADAVERSVPAGPGPLPAAPPGDQGPPFGGSVPLEPLSAGDRRDPPIGPERVEVTDAGPTAHPTGPGEVSMDQVVVADRLAELEGRLAALAGDLRVTVDDATSAAAEAARAGAAARVDAAPGGMVDPDTVAAALVAVLRDERLKDRRALERYLQGGDQREGASHRRRQSAAAVPASRRVDADAAGNGLGWAHDVAPAAGEVNGNVVHRPSLPSPEELIAASAAGPAETTPEPSPTSGAGRPSGGTNGPVADEEVLAALRPAPGGPPRSAAPEVAATGDSGPRPAAGPPPPTTPADPAALREQELRRLLVEWDGRPTRATPLAVVATCLLAVLTAAVVVIAVVLLIDPPGRVVVQTTPLAVTTTAPTTTTTSPVSTTTTTPTATTAAPATTAPPAATPAAPAVTPAP